MPGKPYENHNGAQFVVEILKEWAKLDYRTQLLQPHAFGLSTQSLYTKMMQGFKWLIDNLEGDAQEYYRKLRETTKIKRAAHGVTIMRIRVDRAFVEVPAEDTELMKSFKAWVDSDPPPRARWPDVKRRVRLSDSEIDAFVKARNDLQAQGFYTVARIEPNNLIFIRVPEPYDV